MKQFFLKIFKKSAKKKGRKSNAQLRQEKITKTVTILFGCVLLAGGLAFFVVKNPSVFVVAKVNNSYISRIELNKVLINNFGPQTLEELVYKKLAGAKIKENNIVVTDEELSAKLGEIEQSLGGMSLEDALSSSGMSVDELRENIRFQLALEKLLSNKVQIADEEVQQFLTANATQLEGLSEEEMGDYAREQLKGQKLQVEVSSWFEEIKENSDIKIYL